MSLNLKRADAAAPDEHHKVEKLERLEGMTDKIFMGVVVLVVAVAAVAMIVSSSTRRASARQFDRA